MEGGSGKEGEPKASGAERSGNIDHHRQSFESATYKTGGGYWTRSDEFCEYRLSRSFGRSEGNGTSQLLVNYKAT